MLWFASAFPDSTIISVNLMHHAESKPHASAPEKVSGQHVAALAAGICKQEHISRFALLAYSLGGKIALKIYESMPEKCLFIVLIAPDGLKKLTFYNLVTHNVLFRALFRSCIRKPGFFLGLLNLLLSLRMLPQSTGKFVKKHMETEEKREMVYKVWMWYAGIQISKESIYSLLRSEQTPALFLFGRYDTVIKPRYLYSSYMPSSLSIQAVESGHNLMHMKTLESITAWVKSHV